ncbi:hypothetical protein RvY_04571 [Ramazzottius varieornatus]|uniref:Protein KTI12 homolog n=1 Tax=Ramazzottius varieornatus TaxID=947166 RepID=A0A1D1UVL8_RAMVA|nr:hypothetical protein RvY_04571 [Ramazzottius varieornatus]
MPLVVLCGLPGSGKTKRATELVGALRKSTEMPASVVSDNTILSVQKNDIYAAPAKEKNLRASLKSDVQRLLSKDALVILDAANYIKGYRYEIYCICKSAKTTQCTIWCNAPLSDLKQWNESREQTERYSEATIDALDMRFEPPDSQNRWENPLFTLLPNDPLPVTEILEALLQKRASPPNQSTQSQPLATTNYLHELDRITQEIVSVIISAQQKGSIGGKVILPGTTEGLVLSKITPPAEFTRLRRQFISYSKTRPVESLDRIPTLFVHYLKSTIKVR